MKALKIFGSFAVAASLGLQSAPLLAQEGQTQRAQTQTTTYIMGGATYVKLDPAFIRALGNLGVIPSAIGPGALLFNSSGVTAAFPVTTGAIDNSPVFTVLDHSGGLALRTTRNRGSLTSFIIDSKTGQLSGLVTCNSNLAGRLPLFNLSLTQAPNLDDTMLSIDNVRVTLTNGAASVLSNCLGKTVPPVAVGNASVRASLGPRL